MDPTEGGAVVVVGDAREIEPSPSQGRPEIDPNGAALFASMWPSVVAEHGGELPGVVGDRALIAAARFAEPAAALECAIQVLWSCQRELDPKSPGVVIAIDMCAPGTIAPAHELALAGNRDQILFTGEIEERCAMPDARPLGRRPRPGGGASPVWLSTDSRPNVGRLPVRLEEMSVGPDGG